MNNKMIISIITSTILALFFLFTIGYILIEKDYNELQNIKQNNEKLLEQNITKNKLLINAMQIISISSYDSCLNYNNKTEDCYKYLITNTMNKTNEIMYKGITYDKYWYQSVSIFNRNPNEVINRCTNCILKSKTSFECIDTLINQIIQTSYDKLILNNKWVSSIQLLDNSNIFNVRHNDIYNIITDKNLFKESNNNQSMNDMCKIILISEYQKATKNKFELSNQQMKSINKIIEVYLNPSDTTIINILFNIKLYLYYYREIITLKVQQNNLNEKLEEKININFDKYCKISGNENNTITKNTITKLENEIHCIYWMKIFTSSLTGIIKKYIKTENETILDNQRPMMIQLIKNMTNVYESAKLNKDIFNFNSYGIENCDIFFCDLLIEEIKNFILVDTKYDYFELYNNLKEDNPLKLSLYHHMLNVKSMNITDEEIYNNINDDIQNKTYIPINFEYNSYTKEIEFLNITIKIKIKSEYEDINEYLSSIIIKYIKEIIHIYNKTLISDIEIEYILITANGAGIDRMARKIGVPSAQGMFVTSEERIYIFYFKCENNIIDYTLLELIIHETVHAIQYNMLKQSEMNKELYHSMKSEMSEGYASFISSLLIRGLKNTIDKYINEISSTNMNEHEINKWLIEQPTTDEIKLINRYKRIPLFLSYLYSCDRLKFNPTTLIKNIENEYNKKENKIEKEFKEFLKLNIKNKIKTENEIEEELRNVYNIPIQELNNNLKLKQDDQVKCII